MQPRFESVSRLKHQNTNKAANLTMTALLRQSTDLPPEGTYQKWFAVTGTQATLGGKLKLPHLAEKLENAFMDSRETWWAIGQALSQEPTAEYAHMPTGGAFGSDFGVMLAWSRLTETAANQTDICLVICDDPWLFRHLANLPNVAAGTAPPLQWIELKLSLRGWLARIKTALKNATAAIALRNSCSAQRSGGTAILVYGHPQSTADGYDAYFGNLMAQEPTLTRVLHIDCYMSRARTLASDGRTSSLHGWGSPLFALRLIFTRWKTRVHTKHNWLIRRSVAHENSGGGPAMTRWQQHCQHRWLKKIKPARVCWPWENHAWERGLCRSARQLNVHTLGYQHTVVGPHQINYATATNPDGLESIPDLVICDGPAYRDEIAAWGVPHDRLRIGGAFRFKRFKNNYYELSGPIFVPLSAIPAAAQCQIDAAKKLAAHGHKVIVKEHPMYPVTFAEGTNLSRTDVTLVEQTGLSAVLFCTGTSGLEALLMGLPTYRLILEDRIAIDILPAIISVPNVTLETVEEHIINQSRSAPVDWGRVLAEPDMNLWHSLLFGDMHADKTMNTHKAL
jgi:hypothetical protein